jgi:DNA end-binding protein Ku
MIMLEAWDKGLIGTTLHYPYEIREATEYFDDIPDVKVAPDMLKLADHILKSKASDFDPSQFVDYYEQALLEMLKKKQAGIATPRGRAAPPQQNVVNLMDALRRSLAQEKAASAPRNNARKRIEGQRELLLPIAGKKSKEPATRPIKRASPGQKKAG